MSFINRIENLSFIIPQEVKQEKVARDAHERFLEGETVPELWVKQAFRGRGNSDLAGFLAQNRLEEVEKLPDGERMVRLLPKETA